MIIKQIFTSLLLLITFCTSTYADELKLMNRLGTGQEPRLILKLSSNNGPGYSTFSIDYGQSETIPWVKNPDIKKGNQNWSPWNIFDDKDNYYGTVTILLDASASFAKIQSYDNNNAAAGFNLEGLKLAYNAATQIYELTADKVVTAASYYGPFPEAPLAKPALYSDTNTAINLRVTSDSIVNDRGEKILLKGFARPSLEWSKTGEKLSENDFKNMREKWGANVIRINLNQAYWLESEPVTVKGSYKQIINAMVYYAIQYKMAVILDLHWLKKQRPGLADQDPMANRESLKFWKQVADDYKNFGTVMFELFNEPYIGDPTVWLNGDRFYAGYQEMYDAVRATGAENICIANGLNWGYDLSFLNDSFQLTGYNIVYGSHPYNEKLNPGDFSWLLGRYPLIFTEFGANEDSYYANGRYQQVYANMLEFARQNNISYTGYAWWHDDNLAKRNSFPDLIKNWEGDPFNGGDAIYRDMIANPATSFTH